jgi:hypothetical protein
MVHGSAVGVGYTMANEFLEYQQRIADLEAALDITWRYFPFRIGMDTQWSAEEHEAKWAIINKALGRDGRIATWMTKCS